MVKFSRTLACIGGILSTAKSAALLSGSNLIQSIPYITETVKSTTVVTITQCSENTCARTHAANSSNEGNDEEDIASCDTNNSTTSETPIGSSFDYENEKIRGVNLGGWFVLEPFINPSIFEQNTDNGNVTVDEYHLCKALGKDACYELLLEHWDTWISEADIANISDLGLNMVRIPIGYWAFETLESDPYVQGQTKYLDRALEWCRKYNIKVWIDLHGAPGSQNGFDNSGLRDQIEFQEGNNVEITLNVLSQILENYGGSKWDDVIIGIELLNEPLGSALDMNKLIEFFNKGYEIVKKSLLPKVIIHDAFEQMGFWNNYFNDSKTVIDHHHYDVFAPELVGKTIDEHIETACSWGKDGAKESHINVVGEWSGALTDCTKWLNGAGRGARYSGIFEGSTYVGSCEQYESYDSWPQSFKEDTRRFIEAQLDAYEQAAGWIFWTWKTESSAEWDLSKLVVDEIFPSPLDDRKYGNQCGF